MENQIPNLGTCPIAVKPLSELNPADYNPRQISESSRNALIESIKKFGITVPILWNKQTGNIVGGHQRYFILQELGIKETPIAYDPSTLEKAIVDIEQKPTRNKVWQPKTIYPSTSILDESRQEKYINGR